jgi:hypothetical protein
VEQLNERLSELDAERDELAKYQQVDRQRRSLEYTIYDKELSDTKAKLEQVGGEGLPSCYGCSSHLFGLPQGCEDAEPSAAAPANRNSPLGIGLALRALPHRTPRASAGPAPPHLACRRAATGKP